IDDILDLSKIEAGRMDVEPSEVDIDDVRAYVEQAFAPQAEDKGLAFGVEIADGVPPTIVTDPQKLQQVLRNLLSTAVKFTDTGSVTLRVAPAPADLAFDAPALRGAAGVVAFTVVDTGSAIAEGKPALTRPHSHHAA